MLQNRCKGMIFYPNNQKKRHKKHKSATFFDLGGCMKRKNEGICPYNNVIIDENHKFLSLTTSCPTIQV